MIDIAEFSALKGIPLDLRVVTEWCDNPDLAFAAYVLENHSVFDYQHLRCAMQILQAVNREDVREFYKQYSNHPEIGYRSLANDSLEIQRQRGWISKLPVWA